MKEKKELSVEEIEAQMLLELPDRQLMQVGNENDILVLISQIASVFIGSPVSVTF